MTKKKATVKRATKAQLERLDDLGEQIHGDKWDDSIRVAFVSKELTYDKAKELITDLQLVLGGNV